MTIVCPHCAQPLPAFHGRTLRPFDALRPLRQNWLGRSSWVEAAVDHAVGTGHNHRACQMRDPESRCHRSRPGSLRPVQEMVDQPCRPARVAIGLSALAAGAFFRHLSWALRQKAAAADLPGSRSGSSERVEPARNGNAGRRGGDHQSERWTARVPAVQVDTEGQNGAAWLIEPVNSRASAPGDSVEFRSALAASRGISTMSLSWQTSGNHVGMR